MHRAALFLSSGLLLAAAAAGCVPKPKANYTLEQIPQLNSLEEIMRVQAQAMDPVFAKRNQGSFTDEEYTAIAAAAGKVEVTSVTVRDKFAAGHKPSFVTYATDLNRNAGELLKAAQAKDAANTALLLQKTKDTCRGCHKENR